MKQFLAVACLAVLALVPMDFGPDGFRPMGSDQGGTSVGRRYGSAAAPSHRRACRQRQGTDRQGQRQGAPAGGHQRLSFPGSDLFSAWKGLGEGHKKG